MNYLSSAIICLRNLFFKIKDSNSLTGDKETILWPCVFIILSMLFSTLLIGCATSDYRDNVNPVGRADIDTKLFLPTDFSSTGPRPTSVLEAIEREFDMESLFLPDLEETKVQFSGIPERWAVCTSSKDDTPLSGWVVPLKYKCLRSDIRCIEYAKKYKLLGWFEKPNVPSDDPDGILRPPRDWVFFQNGRIIHILCHIRDAHGSRVDHTTISTV